MGRKKKIVAFGVAVEQVDFNGLDEAILAAAAKARESGGQAKVVGTTSGGEEIVLFTIISGDEEVSL